MNIKLNKKDIIEKCGIVSFKRGASFFRTNKITFEHYSAKLCQATVEGVENFHVTIQKDSDAEILTKCSCPKLATFDRDCQHIAAVLIAISEHQRQGTKPLDSGSTEQKLTGELLNIFREENVRSIAQQKYFENRQVLDVCFTCKPAAMERGGNLFGIEITIETTKVKDIRAFLQQVKEGIPCSFSPSFIYDQSFYCFQEAAEAVIQALIQVTDDEKVYGNTFEDKSMLCIPPSSWHHLRPLLTKAPLVKLEYNGETYEGLRVVDESLPLKFDFREAGDNCFHLKIESLGNMVIFDSYQSVLYGGKLKLLENKDCKRLSDLKQMLNDSGTNLIPISQEQVGFFLENIAPSLRMLGEVHISRAVTKQFLQTPLTAKLYLDRVGNRLLAGLEFHYENWIINPLENKGTQAISLLLRDLDKEAEIMKLMEEGLFAKTDGGYFLHNEELEYQFLYHILPQLQKHVQIYATTAVRNRIFRVNSVPHIKVKLKKERINWLEFKFEMDGIPERQIREVLAALEEKRKYYRLRNGSLLSLETREMKEIQRFLHSPHVHQKSLANGLDLPIEQCLQLLDTFAESETFKATKSFQQFIENLHNPSKLEFEVPNSLQPFLRDYQKLGFKWMKTLAYYGFGGILADDMGLGKTVQSLAFILSGLPDIRKQKLPVLIVCPSSLTYNWLSEIMKFTPELQAVVIDGDKAERSKTQKDIGEMDVLITSYPLLRRDIKWYEKQSFYTVFFDEAQAFKNPVTQTARAVKKIQAVHRFALTGTPVENSLEELWSIFHVVFPELFLGLKEYSLLSKKNIARRIRPFLLRRLKEDVLSELPDKMESLEVVELFPEQKKLYAAYLAKLRHDTLKHLDKDTIRKNRLKILAGLTRLRQICCHPGLFVDGYNGSSAKLERLIQIVEESRHSGRRMLIFSQFTKMLNLIGRELTKRGRTFFYLDGKTPSEERVAICNRFNTGERDLFLISLKAGGTGLNLMTADTVLLFDTWWNPAVEEQAADRAHRMGQKHAVQVIKLVTQGTIEEKMNELQEKKRMIIEEIIDTQGNGSSVFSDEDIRELLMS